MRGRKAPGVLLVALAIVGGIGCGDSEENAGGKARRERLTQVELVAEVIRKQSLAIAEGDGEAACGYFSPQARQSLDELLRARSPELQLDCVSAVGEIPNFLSPDLVSALREPALTGVRVTGDRAEAELQLPRELERLVVEATGDEGPRGATPLRRLGGEWKVDGLVF